MFEEFSDKKKKVLDILEDHRYQINDGDIETIADMIEDSLKDWDDGTIGDVIDLEDGIMMVIHDNSELGLDPSVELARKILEEFSIQ